MPISTAVTRAFGRLCIVRPLELVLFEADPVRATAARAQGISSFIFDVETRGKAHRQRNFNTEISPVSLSELSPFVVRSEIHPICRLDPLHEGTTLDIERAIASGAGELLFPMVRTVAEVKHLLSLVAGRVPAGIMIETEEILGYIPAISSMPLSRAYVGLNDLMISRGAQSLFEPMIDGTVDRIRGQIGGIRFGVAGGTRVDRGSPVPFRLLLAELARLEIDFTMLRRAFRRDVKLNEIGPAIEDLQQLWRELRTRPQSKITSDRAAFIDIVTSVGQIRQPVPLAS